MSEIGIAVFVKTPELSPVKTRLAKSIGTEQAKEFFKKSCAAVQQTLDEIRAQHPEVTVYWAVAEEEGFEHWNGFAIVGQGTGGLGERLYTVSAKLMSKHQSIILLGADSPQLCPQTLSKAIKHLKQSDGAVLGPASDGGFYLAGFSQNLAASTWTSIPYSSDETYAHIKSAFTMVDSVVELRARTDVDFATDLPYLVEEMAGLPHLNHGQQELRHYVLELIRRSELKPRKTEDSLRISSPRN